ncbi:DNA mismatch repair protein [Chitinophaga sp. SYP-B3965]|uniref:MutS-related protein n=1 Tax=Chitinophaga sp. SYP-B3965 TaxID=2663120 RepID=UPI001299950D|nr:DNA mismatch repair protein [Chitinophaga sp. SYP-B3965]MRG43560.1 DNA mismatch repair protein [Chitinophaga sp. SYP-B3965]
MSFIADKQTLDDLNLIGKYNNSSILHLFRGVKTRGGEKQLEQMFQFPLTDAEAINHRSSMFRYFGDKAFLFPFTGEQVDVAAAYLSSGGNILQMKLQSYIGLPAAYEQLTEGLKATLKLLQTLKTFLQDIDQPDWDPVKRTLQNIPVAAAELSLFNLLKYDRLIRHKLNREVKEIMQAVYLLDVYISVSAIAVAKGFNYAQALPADKNIIRVTGLYHPRLDKGITNNIAADGNSNVIFLTGANMAGKSTFMKSFGISLYLAHMGFPVAAQKMEFSVKDGIYSSINVPDNLSLGYSHFYAEVLRVKKVAQEVSTGKNLLVIFDELFKGTNVKDAHDATLSVSAAFSENRNCSFIISTHIIEVGEALKESCNNFQFVYLPTVMNGTVPTYTYKLQEGITEDRHGMMIIENEGILGMILK